jgi:hypothetical protein
MNIEDARAVMAQINDKKDWDDAIERSFIAIKSVRGKSKPREEIRRKMEVQFYLENCEKRRAKSKGTNQ